MTTIIHRLYKNYEITHNSVNITLDTNYAFMCFYAFINKKIIDYDDFHILFHSINCINIQLYHNHQFIILKIFINDTNNIYNNIDLIHYELSKKSKSIGQLIDISHVLFKNKSIRYNIYEYIDNMFNIQFIKTLNFIEFYSIIIDYLKAIDVIHKSGYIHCNIKPIQLMVNKYKIGKLIGFDDIISIENNMFYYHNTSGSIDCMAYERFAYFMNNGFIGNTSICSDIWELYYSILVSCDIISNREELENIYNNGGLVYFLIDKLSKQFKLSYTDNKFWLLHKLATIIEIALGKNPILRKDATNHINILLHNSQII